MWTLLTGFEHLKSEEMSILINAPVLATVLVGAADGQFDREERTWSAKLVEARTYAKPESLREYYRIVARDFLEKADELLAGLPNDAADRNTILSQRLSALNDIFPKLDSLLAWQLYKSLLGLAAETAKASGGFLRIGAVSSAEHAWVNLPMLTPVAPPSDLPQNDQWDDENEEENA